MEVHRCTRLASPCSSSGGLASLIQRQQRSRLRSTSSYAVSQPMHGRRLRHRCCLAGLVWCVPLSWTWRCSVIYLRSASRRGLRSWTPFPQWSTLSSLSRRWCMLSCRPSGAASSTRCKCPCYQVEMKWRIPIPRCLAAQSKGVGVAVGAVVHPLPALRTPVMQRGLQAPLAQRRYILGSVRAAGTRRLTLAPDTSAMDVDVAAESSGGFPSPVPQASASSFHERESYGVVREENPSPDPVRKVPLPMSVGADSASGTPVQVDLDSSFRPAGLRLEHSQPKSAAQPGPAAPSSVLDGGLLEVVASGQCLASPLLRAPAAVAITANRPASTEDFELQAREDDLADLGASVDPYASAPCPPSPVPEANQTGSMLGSRSEAVNQSEGHCQQTPAPTFEVVPFCHVYCRRRMRQWRSHVVAKCTPTLQDCLDKQCKTEMNSVATVLRYTPFASALASPQAGASHRSWNPLQLLKSRPLSLESPSRWGA
jgi:hypothetical protein